MKWSIERGLKKDETAAGLGAWLAAPKLIKYSKT
jgi:hypothetical protein